MSSPFSSLEIMPYKLDTFSARKSKADYTNTRHTHTHRTLSAGLSWESFDEMALQSQSLEAVAQESCADETSNGGVALAAPSAMCHGRTSMRKTRRYKL